MNKKRRFIVCSAIFFLLSIFIFLLIRGQNKDRKYMDAKDYADLILSDPLRGKSGKIFSTFCVEGSHPPKDYHYVFFYNGYDCEDCIRNGFKIVALIDSLLNPQKVTIIGSMANIGLDQKKYKYYNYIYYDERDTIRKIMKFIPTPILLKIDSTETISASYQPLVSNLDALNRLFDKLSSTNP